MNSPAIKRISRWQAASIHLTCSATLAVLAAILLFGVWFPQPFTEAAGADRLIMLLIGIDLVLGPLLTLIVYQQGKKGMLFDLAFIATVQFAALVYGLIMIAQSRPIFVVVSKDMTFLTSMRSISDADLALAPNPAFRTRSWTGPILVAAPPPADPKERDELLFASLAGKDIDRTPKYYHSFDEAGPALVAQSRPLSDLAGVPAARAMVEAFVTLHELPIEQLRFQALRGRDPEADSTVVFNTATSSIVGVIGIDPWLAPKEPDAEAPSKL